MARIIESKKPKVRNRNKKAFVQIAEEEHKSFLELLGRHANLYMEKQIEDKSVGSPSANSDCSSADGARAQYGRRGVCASVVASHDAACSTDPDNIVQTESLSTTENNGVDKVNQPGEFDILCGRGRAFQEHPGNIVLRHMVELHMGRFKRAKRNYKSSIASEIVAAFNANGNHFLKQDGETEVWEEIQDEVAKEKVNHCFRSRFKVLSSNTTSFSSPAGSFQQQLKNSSSSGQLY
jgi:hypothetical protein